MKLVLILAIFMLGLCFSSNASADENKEPDWDELMENEIKEQAGTLDLAEWREFLSGTEGWEGVLLPATDINEMVTDMALGRFEINIAKIAEQAANALYGGVLINIRWMAKIMVLAVICGVIRNMNDSFSHESVGEIVFFACYATIVLLLIQSFIPVIEASNEAIQRMIRFMQVFFPVLIAFLIAVGGIVSSAVMQPAIALMVGLIGVFLKNVMIPLILMAAVLVLINHISDKMRLNSLSTLVTNAIAWMLGGIFTIFIGVLAVQGVVAASFDGVSVRTAKYAIDAFVPVVGGMFSQAVDIVIGCSLMVKNALGVAGLLILVLICINPAMNVLSLIAVYKISGALLEPVTDERIVDCLNGVGNVMTMLFITVSGVAIMFFIVVAFIVAAGNMTVMLR